MSYTTYTSKVSLPITYQWKCSKCGTINRVSTTVYTSAQTMSGGRKVNAQSQYNASSMAKTEMNNIVKALFGETPHFYQYKKLGLNSKCESCSHKEPWSAKNLDWLTNILIKLGVIVLFIDAILFVFGLFSVFNKNKTSAQRKTDIIGLLIMLGIAAVLIGGFFLIMHLISKHDLNKDIEISKLPKSSLPIMVLDGKPVIDYEMIERTEAGRNEKIEIEHRIDRPTSSIPQKPVQQEGKIIQPDNTSAKNIPYSEADEIEKFKGLLDKGIITKEEFEAKKKQLLGIY